MSARRVPSPRTAVLAALALAQSLTAAQTITRRLVNCSPKALAGQEICLCFENAPPDLRAVLLDGRQTAVTQGRRFEGANVVNIPHVFSLRLPSDIAPGEHWITAPPAQGRVRVEVVEPRFEINPSRLKRGQTARVRFSIAGTREKVTVTLRNATPAIVALLDESGRPANEQTVETSGGDANAFTRQVRADALGDFVIATTLDLGPCPCGGPQLTQGPRAPGGVDGPPSASTPEGGTPGPRLGILLTRDDDAWIPAARPNPPDCGKGVVGSDTTSLTARLYENAGGGWQPTTIPRLIRMAFARRSQEPGVALNLRSQGSGEIPDLYFLSFDARGQDRFSCERDASGMDGACTTLEPVTEASIRVRATDFGAYGSVDASCRDCVRLRRAADGAIVEGAAGDAASAVTIPKDDNGNHIADAHVWDIPMLEDLDGTPGSAFSGDGLTGYEEYRGFAVQGCHVRTSPGRKDLFVFNPDGADLSLFVSASGLMVWQINGAELDGSRVVNFGRSPDTSLGEQHAIRLDVSTSTKQVELGAQGNCDFGPPKNVKKCAVLPGSSADTVAHELGHGVGMRHHGDIGLESIDLIRAGNPIMTALSTVVPGTATRVNAAACCGKPLNTNTVTTFELGHRHDQGSGDLGCIMVYEKHGEMVSDPQAPLGYCCTPPSTRAHFCASPTGTGANANNACRGDASSGRGNCKAQIHVNDHR